MTIRGKFAITAKRILRGEAKYGWTPTRANSLSWSTNFTANALRHHLAVNGRWMPVEFHTLMKESFEAEMRLPGDE